MSPRDPIDYSCFLLRKGAVFELHQGLSDCPVGAEADYDIQGGEYTAHGLGQMMDIW